MVPAGIGPRADRKVLTSRGATPHETTARQPLSADIDGFSLNTAARVEAHRHGRLVQLCRCITRPAPSDEWVQLNAAGQVALKLKTPWQRSAAEGSVQAAPGRLDAACALRAHCGPCPPPSASEARQ